MLQQLMWKFLHCKGEAANETVKTTGNDTKDSIMHPDLSKHQVQKNLQIVPYNLFHIQKTYKLSPSSIKGTSTTMWVSERTGKIRAKSRKSNKLIRILKI